MPENIPFKMTEKRQKARRSDNDRSTVSRRQSTIGARLSDGDETFDLGKAVTEHNPDGMSVLQRAAKRRLNDGKPGSFAAKYERN